MKVIPYTDILPTHIDNESAKGVAGRVLVGKNDGANNFCMRMFEIAPGGYTPKHTHPWEHEMFIHAGSGEIYCGGDCTEIFAGHVAFIPANNEHQIKNTGNTLLKVVCLVPPQAPEM
ncbi:MAG: cupin domain-containing protein [Deltaproteobacteria bacterium HGW-Deltaproteobacteria-10]|nr:MAG: cupin domain-containing protein [Deltaproteobacteria bacterium HGW-Deltaproteobacteria-10]